MNSFQTLQARGLIDFRSTSVVDFEAKLKQWRHVREFCRERAAVIGAYSAEKNDRLMLIAMTLRMVGTVLAELYSSELQAAAEPPLATLWSAASAGTLTLPSHPVTLLMEALLSTRNTALQNLLTAHLTPLFAVLCAPPTTPEDTPTANPNSNPTASDQFTAATELAELIARCRSQNLAGRGVAWVHLGLMSMVRASFFWQN
jgi:hypothetical protein